MKEALEFVMTVLVIVVLLFLFEGEPDLFSKLRAAAMKAADQAVTECEAK